jgi:hypothetical protein
MGVREGRGGQGPGYVNCWGLEQGVEQKVVSRAVSDIFILNRSFICLDVSFDTRLEAGGIQQDR